ncbi:MAG: DUF899 family protein [Phycisphaerales bacterium]
MPITLDEIRQLEDQIGELKSKLAAARREAPAENVKNYSFKAAGTGSQVTLLDLFGAKNELIVVHNMGHSCVYCTLWADGFTGMFRHLSDRAGFVLSSPDDPARAAQFAADRGWPFPVVSTTGSSFARDMGFENEGKPMPGVSTFRRTGDQITRTGSTSFGPGDDFCAVWPLLELLGVGTEDWKPKYHYETWRK